MEPRKYLAQIGLFISFILLFGCANTSNNGFEYNFENLTSKPINVKIYSSLSDYNNSSNVFLTGRMEVRGYYTVPIGKFEMGKTYYVDWYSDDLSYTNWYWSNITLRTTFTVSNSDYEYLVNTVEFADPSRKIWMNGLGTTTTWKAVNAYIYTGSSYLSIWSTLSSAQRNVQLVLNKDFSANLLLQGTGNDAVDSILSYEPNYDTLNHLSVVTLLNIADTSIGTLTSNFNPSTLTFNGDNNTMLVYIKSLGYFEMTRQ